MDEFTGEVIEPMTTSFRLMDGLYNSKPLKTMSKKDLTKQYHTRINNAVKLYKLHRVLNEKD
jgi:hypothetical protein